ncbi:hypothetical protein DFP72DRAFT_857702 [Ephemerocybe angulata]|uniref:Uncharacterized protein n=1 Tax=Ephemerocybe angulata TaxID=980116 RepID=A0A8H6HCF8_9AGAR|nr:hypothetical protein DFP72DRAFT_857702 [Tulosesus angulatus]
MLQMNPPKPSSSNHSETSSRFSAVLADSPVQSKPDTPFNDGSPLASKHCPGDTIATTIEALLASLSALAEDEMTAIVYHASKALFTNGKKRVDDYKQFFFQVGSDWQASRLHQSVEVWQTALFAGLLLLQRYYSINLLRGHKSTSYDLLSEYRIDAVVFAAAIMALQHSIVDEHYSSPALDVEMGYPKGTHESCKIALLRGLEWNLHVNAADLAKFTQDVTWAWPTDFALLYILKRSPFGQYGGPSKDDLFLDGGITPPTAQMRLDDLRSLFIQSGSGTGCGVTAKGDPDNTPLTLMPDLVVLWATEGELYSIKFCIRTMPRNVVACADVSRRLSLIKLMRITLDNGTWLKSATRLQRFHFNHIVPLIQTFHNYPDSLQIALSLFLNTSFDTKQPHSQEILTFFAIMHASNDIVALQTPLVTDCAPIAHKDLYTAVTKALDAPEKELEGAVETGDGGVPLAELSGSGLPLVEQAKDAEGGDELGLNVETAMPTPAVPSPAPHPAVSNTVESAVACVVVRSDMKESTHEPQAGATDGGTEVLSEITNAPTQANAEVEAPVVGEQALSKRSAPKSDKENAPATHSAKPPSSRALPRKSQLFGVLPSVSGSDTAPNPSPEPAAPKDAADDTVGTAAAVTPAPPPKSDLERRHSTVELFQAVARHQAQVQVSVSPRPAQNVPTVRNQTPVPGPVDDGKRRAQLYRWNERTQMPIIPYSEWVHAPLSTPAAASATATPPEGEISPPTAPAAETSSAIAPVAPSTPTIFPAPVSTPPIAPAVESSKPKAAAATKKNGKGKARDDARLLDRNAGSTSLTAQLEWTLNYTQPAKEKPKFKEGSSRGAVAAPSPPSPTQKRKRTEEEEADSASDAAGNPFNCDCVDRVDSKDGPECTRKFPKRDMEFWNHLWDDHIDGKRLPDAYKKIQCPYKTVQKACGLRVKNNKKNACKHYAEQHFKGMLLCKEEECFAVAIDKEIKVCRDHVKTKKARATRKKSG